MLLEHYISVGDFNDLFLSSLFLSTTMKTIAIIGGTGMLGAPVVHALVRSGFTVSALVRDIPKAKTLLPTGVEFVFGDIRNTERELDKLLSGKEYLYLNLSVAQGEKSTDFHTETDGLKIILEAARRNGIRRIGYLSSLVQRYQGMNGYNWWVFDVKLRAVRLLQDSGIPTSIFYASSFMENFTHGFKQGKRLNLAGTSRFPMHWIAAEDYARQVTTAFSKPDGEIRSEYVVQGPKGLTSEQAAATFVKHYAKEKLSIASAPLGVLKFLGRFMQPMNYVANLVEALNNYPEQFEAQTTWDELGKPTITLEQFAVSIK